VGKLYQHLTAELIEFIQSQDLFFVGSAPRADDGHINISPKGMDCLRVLDEHTLAYLDVTGSGVDTIAHVRENRRLVMMFCAFKGRPLILRIHGWAEVLQTCDAEFQQLRPHFDELPGVRSIIRLNATRIADSCGWTVPIYERVGERDYYQKFADKLGPAGLQEAQLAANMQSIDGLTALDQPSVPDD